MIKMPSQVKVDMMGLNTNVNGDGWLSDWNWHKIHQDDAIDIHAGVGSSR
jgi:hypothetical protein